MSQGVAGDTVALPTAVTLVLAEFGDLVGIPGMMFDAKGRCVLEVEAQEVLLGHQRHADALLLQAVVGLIPAGPKSNLYAALLVMNHAVTAQGFGALSIDAADGLIHWSDRLEVRNLTAGMLLDRVIRGARQAKTVSVEIDRLLDDNDAGAAAEANAAVDAAPVAPKAQDYEPMIIYRV